MQVNKSQLYLQPQGIPVPPKKDIDELIFKTNQILKKLKLEDIKINISEYPNGHQYVILEGPAYGWPTVEEIKEKVWKELKIALVYLELKYVPYSKLR